jgi:uncharacterized protein (DUF2461 family)
MPFDGFTKEALGFYQDLRDNDWDLNHYNSIKPIYHKQIKPVMEEMLDDLAFQLQSKIKIMHPDSKRLGEPYPRKVSPTAWGAITKLGAKKGKQLFIAMRPQTIRIGLYIPQKNEREGPVEDFKKMISKIYNQPEEFLRLLDEAKQHGLVLCRSPETKDLAKDVVDLELDSEKPHLAIHSHGHFDLVVSYPISMGAEPALAEEASRIFEALVPMWEYLS